MGSATLLVSYRGATYIVLLALSVGIELVSSASVSESVSQLSFKKVSVSSLSEFQTPVLIDRTPCTHGSDKNPKLFASVGRGSENFACLVASKSW